jgi:hypothetical protein
MLPPVSVVTSNPFQRSGARTSGTTWMRASPTPTRPDLFHLGVVHRRRRVLQAPASPSRRRGRRRRWVARTHRLDRLTGAHSAGSTHTRTWPDVSTSHDSAAVTVNIQPAQHRLHPSQQLLARSCSDWIARSAASYRIVRAPRWGCTHAHDRTWQALPLQVIAHSGQHACLATLVAVLHGTCSSSGRDEASASRRCPFRQGRWVRAEAQEWRGRGTCSAPALRRCSPPSERVTNVLATLLSPARSHILLARPASAGGHHCLTAALVLQARIDVQPRRAAPAAKQCFRHRLRR